MLAIHHLLSHSASRRISLHSLRQKDAR